MSDYRDILQRLKILNPCYATSWGDGSWCTNTSHSLVSFSPTDKTPLATVYLCSHHDYETLMARSVSAQRQWCQVPAPQRGELVRRIGMLLREHKDALGSLISVEMGKIKQEADGEVQEMIDMADFAVGQSRMLYGKTMHSERPQHRMYEQWHPLGVVGVITAFNFPMAVWAWNAFIAAIAGNTVVWKPSSQTPLCAVAVHQLCQQVMVEMGYPGIFSVFLPAASSTTAALVADRRAPLISFTGSSAVGRSVAQTVAARMGRSLLECSGNNALIVDATADLSLAIPAIVFGAIGTAGQRCTTTRRLFVHAHCYDAVIERLLHAYRQVVLGDPLLPTTLMGPLIDGAAVADYESAIRSACAAGGKLLYGGRRLSGPGNFVEPTLIEIDASCDIVKNETFAPILYVMRFTELSAAIALQNDVPQGLSSALFTNDLRHAEQFLAATGSDCGIANINIGTSGAEIGGAFGGEKETGGGREAGSDAWQAYMRRQTTTINWGTTLPLAQGIKFGA